MTTNTALAPDNSGPAQVAAMLRRVTSGATATIAKPTVTTRQRLSAQEEARYSEAFARIVGE